MDLSIHPRKPRATIYDWIVLHERLHGNAYGHPKFYEGEPITSAPIVFRDPEFIETKNTIYILGDPA